MTNVDPDGARPSAYHCRYLAAVPARSEPTQPAEHETTDVFVKACALGLEGIVPKRAGRFYRSGKSRTWLKTVNPDFVGEYDQRSASVLFRNA
jgi:hypothetical protein